MVWWTLCLTSVLHKHASNKLITAVLTQHQRLLQDVLAAVKKLSKDSNRQQGVERQVT